jgi:hypothetical protein
MAYIGRGIDKLSNIEKLDVITFDGSSSYSLTKNSVAFTPSSANSLQVSIDGVVQAGNFTVSGSTIDFGTAVASTSTNDFIFHYGTGLITTPADGTVGLNQLSATGTKDATTFLRGDNTFAAAGGSNTPIIFAKATSATSMANGTATKITLDNEVIDTGGVFASSRFTATTAGKYKITGILSVNLTSATAALNSFIYKNGGAVSNGVGKSNEGSANTVSSVTSIIISLSATDYIELYGSHNDGGSLNSNTGNLTSLEIFKLVE